MMCGYRRRLQHAGAEYPADGETVRLADLPRGEGRRRGPRFPWWTLWMLWPLFWMAKGAVALAAPAVAWLGQPILLTVTPLPLLLVGAGVAILLGGALRRGRDA